MNRLLFERIAIWSEGNVGSSALATKETRRDRRLRHENRSTHLQSVPHRLHLAVSILLQLFPNVLTAPLVEIPGREEHCRELDGSLRPRSEETDGEEFTKSCSARGERREGKGSVGETNKFDPVEEEAEDCEQSTT